MTDEPRPAKTIPAGVKVGHVHLKVSDLDRSLGFYRDVLGFEVTMRSGDQAVFLAAGDYHHHLVLNTWQSRGGPSPAPNMTGLYHTAFLYPTRADLAQALRRLREAGIPIDFAADHGVAESLYVRDPDGNGVELTCDRAPELWPRDAEGNLITQNKHIDPDALFTEATVPNDVGILKGSTPDQ